MSTRSEKSLELIERIGGWLPLQHVDLAAPFREVPQKRPIWLKVEDGASAVGHGAGAVKDFIKASPTDAPRLVSTAPQASVSADRT